MTAYRPDQREKKNKQNRQCKILYSKYLLVLCEMYFKVNVSQGV